MPKTKMTGRHRSITEYGIMKAFDGRFAALQITGKRDYQEDSFGLLDECDLGLDCGEHAVLLVADGMGGHVGGAIASDLLCKTFIEAYPRSSGPIVDRLRACLDEANGAITAAVDENPALASMGSTLVAAVVTSEGLHWISVGDSPLWLFREGLLKRLNADHSMAAELNELVAEGRMTEEEAEQDPRRNWLNSAVMGDEIHLIDVPSQPVAVKKGDRVVLASDGLLTLNNQEIAESLKKTRDAPLKKSAEDLIEKVKEKVKKKEEEAERPYYQDNTTVLLYAPQAD